MQLSPKQFANDKGSSSHGLPSNLVLPGCYYLADKENQSSWVQAYRECMMLGGESSLFYATNDFDAAWLAEKLESLQAGRHVQLNLHRFLYNAKDWAWAPPPPSVVPLHYLFELNFSSTEAMLCFQITFVSCVK